jgi:chemotaxis regulatin CheY-phosphate phosphatase CheZ
MNKELVGLPVIGEDEKVVDQLDQVTRDSEKKAGEVFDKLELLMNHLQNINNIALELEQLIDKSKIKDKEPYKKLITELSNTANNSIDEIMNTMDIMQYQDIHRQKIERVINIVRALNNYMNKLFSSKIRDEDRVSSAQYIAGDNAEDVLSDEEIEQMLKQFKK